MRFGIAFKVGLLATALVCATGLGIGVWAFFQAARIVVEHELVDLRDETQLKAEHLLSDVAALREDVLYLTRTPQVQAIVRARNSPNAAKLSPEQRTDPVTGLSEHALREELGKVFTRVCHGADAKPKPYLQVRFIGREKNGREIVRVQQGENGQSFYPVDTHLLDTQAQYQKANRPYFNFYLNSLENLTSLNDPRRLETLGVRLSNVELNRDPELQTDKPVLRASVPVWNDDQSEFFGIIVINMDFREIATTLLNSPRHLTYVTNEQGDFLVHPNPLKMFVWEDPTRQKQLNLENCRVQDQIWFQPWRTLYETNDNDHEKELANRGWQIGGLDTPDFDEGIVLPHDGFRMLLVDIHELDRSNTSKDYSELNATIEQCRQIYPQVIFSSQINERSTTLRCRVPNLTNSSEDQRPLDSREVVADIYARIAKPFKHRIRLQDEFACKRFAIQFYRLYFDPSFPERYMGLAVAASYEEFISQVREARRTIGSLIGLMIAGGVALAFLFSRLITRPLKQITSATQRLAHGEFDIKLPVSDGGEIGTLAQSFQDMAHQRKEAENEIKWINESLEQRVRQRTAELQKANEDLAIARDTALAASRAKDSFLANMSHELRTPLNAIIGYSEMLQEDATEAGQNETVEDLRKVQSAGNHLLTLINEVLDLAKVEAGKMDLCRDDFSVTGLIEEVSNAMDFAAGKNNNQLEVSVPPDVGNMRNDRTRVRQVLYNLLSNACKFTHDGTIRLVASPIERSGTSWVEFHVQDTGIGMNPQQLNRLFQPFSQADASTSRKYGGTGLGLAISQRFCTLMGGTIEVNSDVDVGSTFKVVLPREVPGPEDHQVIPGEDSLNTPAPHISQMEDSHDKISKNLVLVIDDDPAVRELIERFLKRDHFQVVTVGDGERGLELAKKLRPAAITLDAILPKMDGWQVLASLKADSKTRDIPVIMISMVDNQNRGFTLGASEYLTKPISREQLTVILSKYLHPNSNASVLVVEDDDNIRKLMCRMLQTAGHIPHEAPNGQVALKQIFENQPALILLDLMMPKMDGFEFLNHLRHNTQWRDIPVVVVTAIDPTTELTADYRKQLNDQVQQVLWKGAYDLDRLMSQIQTLVSNFVRGRDESNES